MGRGRYIVFYYLFHDLPQGENVALLNGFLFKRRSEGPPSSFLLFQYIPRFKTTACNEMAYTIEYNTMHSSVHLFVVRSLSSILKT